MLGVNYKEKAVLQIFRTVGIVVIVIDVDEGIKKWVSTYNLNICLCFLHFVFFAFKTGFSKMLYLQIKLKDMERVVSYSGGVMFFRFSP